MRSILSKSLTFGAACAVVVVTISLVGSSTATLFFLLLACFVALSLFYVLSSGKFELARIFDLPVYVTVIMLLTYGFGPLEVFFDPDRLDPHTPVDESSLVTALLLVIVGMVAFWTGCKVLEPKHRLRPVITREQNSRGRIVAVALVMYAVGFGCKLYLLQSQLFAYTQSLDVYWDNLADAQLFNFGAQFATFSLLILGIEKFSDPSNRLARWLFWGVFFSECVWGLISGMKIILLTNFLAVALVSTIQQGKLARKWLIATVLGLVIIYPFSNAYRALIRGDYAIEVTDFGAAAQALSLAVASGSQTQGSSSDWLQSGSDSTVSRFDTLPTFAMLINMGGKASEIHGDERLWMVPFYPFVPRVIWPSKPILDQAARFSDLLGKGRATATNLPYIGDCYIYAGLRGIVVGMFVLGLFAQRFTNSLNGVVSKYQVLKYSVLLLTCFWLETGAFPFWTSLMKTIVALSVIGWAAYGSLKPRTSPVVLRRMPVPQRA